jgi:alkylation response protein AidB-like acyl-CoA dehydrogenase
VTVFAPNEDQDVLEKTSRRFLEKHYPVERLRELGEDEDVFDPVQWRRAAELGWTILLVPEAAGGGSLSGNGLADLVIVAALFGRYAAPGPLIGTNLVAAALGRWGAPAQHAGPLAALVAGEATAAWAHSGDVVETVTGSRRLLSGSASAVEVAGAALLLVAATAGTHRTHYLVPADAPGVRADAQRSVDLTRRFAEVTFDGVAVGDHDRVGRPGDADRHDEALLDIAAVLASAEITGALSRAFEMTLEWVADRYSFGRPLGSYQEIKHRIADLRTTLEASEAVALRAASAVGTSAASASSWASAAMAYVGRHGPEAIQDCVQLHGGIGVTFEHDIHLFLRRATLAAHLYGAHHDFARRLGRDVVEGSAR